MIWNSKIEKLKSDLRESIMRKNYVKAQKLRIKLEEERQRREVVPLGTMFDDVTAEKKYTIMCQMHRMFVYADLLYGAALDFEACIKQLDKSATVFVVEKAKEAAKNTRDITKNVDEIGNIKLSADFGDMCDEIEKLVVNKINKYMRKK